MDHALQLSYTVTCHCAGMRCAHYQQQSASSLDKSPWVLQARLEG